MDDEQLPSNHDLADLTGMADQPTSGKKVAADIFEEALVPAASLIRDLVAGGIADPSRYRWEAVKFVIEFNFGSTKDAARRSSDTDWERALSKLVDYGG